jgi:hypothetical protein
LPKWRKNPIYWREKVEKKPHTLIYISQKGERILLFLASLPTTIQQLPVSVPERSTGEGAHADPSGFCRPPGLNLILRFLPGVPFGHPGLAYKPAQHLTVAPSGG